MLKPISLVITSAENYQRFIPEFLKKSENDQIKEKKVKQGCPPSPRLVTIVKIEVHLKEENAILPQIKAILKIHKP